MPTVIERLDSLDARAERTRLVALLQDAVLHGASIGFLQPLATAVAERFWDDVIREVETGIRVLLVARSDGQVVGTVQLGLCNKPNGLHRAEVQKLFVHSSARKQGIGRRLMEAVEAEARTARRTLLYLDTEPGQPAELLYRTLGWTLAGLIPDYACTPDGRLHGTALYFKRMAR